MEFFVGMAELHEVCVRHFFKQIDQSKNNLTFSWNGTMSFDENPAGRDAIMASSRRIATSPLCIGFLGNVILN